MMMCIFFSCVYYFYIQETREDIQSNLWDQFDGDVNQDGVRLHPLSKCSRVMGMYMIGLEDDGPIGSKSMLMKTTGYWLYKHIIISIVYGRLPRKLSPDLQKRYFLELVVNLMEAIPYLLILGFDKQLPNTILNERKGSTYHTRGSKTQNSSLERDSSSSNHTLSSSPHLYYTTCTNENLITLMEEVYDYRERHIDTIHEISSIDMIPLVNELNVHLHPLERHHLEILTGSGSEFLMERLTSSG